MLTGLRLGRAGVPVRDARLPYLRGFAVCANVVCGFVNELE